MSPFQTLLSSPRSLYLFLETVPLSLGSMDSPFFPETLCILLRALPIPEGQLFKADAPPTRPVGETGDLGLVLDARDLIVGDKACMPWEPRAIHHLEKK